MTLKVGVGKVANRGGSLSTFRTSNLRPRHRGGSDCAGPSFSSAEGGVYLPDTGHPKKKPAAGDDPRRALALVRAGVSSPKRRRLVATARTPASRCAEYAP